MSRSYNQSCSLARALDVLGERWTLLIVRDLLAGPCRFKDLVSGLPGAGTNLISERLKLLESEKIIESYQGTHGVFLYRLTERGEDLREAIVSLAKWGIGLQVKPRNNTVLRGWWNPIAIQARFDPKLAKGLSCVGHINMLGTTTEIVLVKGKLLATNLPKHTPDFTIMTKGDGISKIEIKDLSIQGNGILAKNFLKSLSF